MTPNRDPPTLGVVGVVDVAAAAADVVDADTLALPLLGPVSKTRTGISTL